MKTIADTALWTEELSLMFPKESKESLQKAVHSASTLEEAADLLCESQEIEVVIEESTVNSDLPLAENVRSNVKEERQVVNEGIYCCLQYKTIIIIIPNKYYRFMHPFVSRTSLFLVVQYVLFFSK